MGGINGKAVASGFDGTCGSSGGLTFSHRAHGAVHTSAPLVVLVRAELDAVKRLMRSDAHVGKGNKQRGMSRSSFGNAYKVSVYGREWAVAMFKQHPEDSLDLLQQLSSLSATGFCVIAPGLSCVLPGHTACPLTAMIGSTSHRPRLKN